MPGFLVNVTLKHLPSCIIRQLALRPEYASRNCWPRASEKFSWMSGRSPIESWLRISFIVQHQCLLPSLCTAFVFRDDTGSSITTPPFQASVLNVKSGRMGATLLYCTLNIHHSTLHGVRVSELWVQQGAGAVPNKRFQRTQVWLPAPLSGSSCNSSSSNSGSLFWPPRASVLLGTHPHTDVHRIK